MADHLSCSERLVTFIELLCWFLPVSSSWYTTIQGIKNELAQTKTQQASLGTFWCYIKFQCAMLFFSLFKRVFWNISDVHMVFAAASGVLFTWFSHWNMDDASTIKCLSPDKGKGKCYFNHFLREISFTVEKSIVYRAFLDTCFLLFKLKCLKQIYSSFLRQPLLYHTFVSYYHQTWNNTCISNGCFFLHEECKGVHRYIHVPFLLP